MADDTVAKLGAAEPTARSGRPTARGALAGRFGTSVQAAPGPLAGS